jgi:hypothetical protein
MMLLRLWVSTESFTIPPLLSVPVFTRTWWRITSFSVFVVLSTSACTSGEIIVPTSPIWPPDSP